MGAAKAGGAKGGACVFKASCKGGVEEASCAGEFADDTDADTFDASDAADAADASDASVENISVGAVFDCGV